MKSKLFCCLKATQTDNPFRSAQSLINIKLIELNSQPPQFESPLYSTSIYENSMINTLVVRVHATDVDANRLVYSILSTPSPPDAAACPFHLDKYSGEIRVSGRLDYEMKSEYVLEIEARDLNFTTKSQVISWTSKFCWKKNINAEFL